MPVVRLLFFISCLFPFVSPYPLESDIQPVCGFLGGVILSVELMRRQLSIPKAWGVWFLLMMFASLYYNPFHAGWPDIGKLFSLFIAAVTMCAFGMVKQHFKYEYLLVGVIVYFVLSILMFQAPATMIEIQNIVIRNTNSTEIGYRGISVLATEPGLFGGLLVCFLCINDYFRSQNKCTSKSYFFLSALVIIMIYWTRSGTGYMYFLCYLFLKMYNGGLKKNIMISSVMIMAVFVFVLLGAYIKSTNFDADAYGRGAQIVVKIISSPEILIEDRSIAYRLNAIFVAAAGLLEAPLGYGLGRGAELIERIINNYDSLHDFYYGYGEDFHAVSALGHYVSVYGFLFVIPYFYVLKKSSASFSNKALSFVFASFSYSFSFPFTWILLSLEKK